MSTVHNIVQVLADGPLDYPKDRLRHVPAFTQGTLDAAIKDGLAERTDTEKTATFSLTKKGREYIAAL